VNAIFISGPGDRDVARGDTRDTDRERRIAESTPGGRGCRGCTVAGKQDDRDQQDHATDDPPQHLAAAFLCL
jgi:hypothetical protein